MTDIKTNKMLVNVVLDRSGSMNGIRKGTIDGYNEYINGLRHDTDSEYNVTLIQFDASGSSRGPELTVSYVDKPLADVSELMFNDYEPRGGTPLYDAIGECVRRVEAKDRAVTVVIITDGEENASAEFTKESIQKLRAEKEALGWTFVFIGADIDAYRAGGALGMSAMNSVSYTKGMESNLYAAVAQSTVTRAHGNATMGVGQTQCMAFFGDEQKMAVGDPSVKAQTTGNIAPASFEITINGGQIPAPVTFRLPETVGGKKPRSWKATITTNLASK